MLGCIDEEVEAAVVGAAQGDDVQQPHGSEAGQQTKCQNDHAQDQTPLPAQTAPLLKQQSSFAGASMYLCVSGHHVWTEPFICRALVKGVK